MPDSVSFADFSVAPAAAATVQIFDPPMCCPTGLCGPALDELNAAFGGFFDPGRIQPRRSTCGPQGTFVQVGGIDVALPQ